MQAASLAAAKNYEKDALDRIRRIGIISAELEVKGKRKDQMFFQGDNHMASRWANEGEGGAGQFSQYPQSFDQSEGFIL